MSTRVIIIGAGVSGLAVGCYLQMNGFDTEILEMHDQPGGLCTAWKRKGCTFDGCIHVYGPRQARGGDAPRRPGPGGRPLIHSLCGAIRKLSRADMPVTSEKMGLWKRLGYLLPWVACGTALKRWSFLSLGTLCSRLRSQVLAEALQTMYGGEGGTCGYPVGGSLEFARAIERRYVSLGAAGFATTPGWRRSWWRRTRRSA